MAIYSDHSWTNIRRMTASLVEKAKTAQRFPKDLLLPSKQYSIHLPLDLPFPHLILEPISTIGLPDETRQKLLKCLTRRVNDLREDYFSIYRRSCLACPSMTEFDIDMLRRACQILYQKQCLPFLEFQVQSLLSGVVKRQQQSSQDKRPIFNAEYIPFLEKYFEHNAYPSASDRLVLARKSVMTPRQIEVWFQNHRNRAKKDGKSLKRLASSLPLEVSLASLAQKMPLLGPAIERPSFSTEDSSDEEVGDGANEVPLPVSSIASFNDLPPPHAFPTRYPPVGCNDAFPNTDGVFRFPSPSWTRHPATSRPCSASINVDELTALFASKLNLREGLSRAQTPQNNSTSCRRPWFTATVTIPSPAPHPALLKTPYMGSTPSASNSCLLYLNQVTRADSESPTRRSPCQNMSKNRKMAPLPRRTLPNAESAVDSLSVLTFSSRASSLSSITSSQSRSTSTSSSISSADPVSLPSSPISQCRDLVQIENGFEAFNEYINQPHSDDLSPLDLGLLAKQTRPAFSQYQTNPFVAVSTSSFLAAQSSDDIRTG